MEKYAELISILLQHSQRFLDFWNYQIVISLATLGFVFSNPAVISIRSIRLFITAIFLMMAVITVFFLSVHQEREDKMYAAIQSHRVCPLVGPYPRRLVLAGQLQQVNDGRRRQGQESCQEQRRRQIAQEERRAEKGKDAGA